MTKLIGVEKIKEKTLYIIADPEDEIFRQFPLTAEERTVKNFYILYDAQLYSLV